jgi:hypothetical protein
MNHRHVPPSAEDPGHAQGLPETGDPGGHGGWGMTGMMLLCCIPMVILIVLAVAGSR